MILEFFKVNELYHQNKRKLYLLKMFNITCTDQIMIRIHRENIEKHVENTF